MDALTALFGLELSIVLTLMVVSFIAAIIDSIAGGGGLLNVPSLMLAGLDPVSAVATNKLQGSFGVLSATRAYARAGLIDWRASLPAFVGSAVGAGFGAVMAQVVPLGALKTAVPFLLIGIALFILLSPKLSDAESRERVRPLVYAVTFAAIIGFYDGIFGPGGGTFFFITLVVLLGQGVTRAAANAKFLNLASNLGAFGLFAFSGRIAWALGLALGVAAVLGAQIGARAALRGGAGLIKPVVVAVSILMALRLMLDPAHPVGAAIAGFLGP